MPGTLLSVKECTLLKGTAEHAYDGNTAQRLFHVRFSTKPDDHDEILTATGLPSISDPYKVGSTKLLKKKTPASLGTVLDYIVTCDYEVPERSFEPDPLDRPDEISGDFTTELRPFFQDLTSPTPKQVLASTGEPFDDLPQRYAGIFRFRVTGNRPTTTDVALWASYLGPTAASYNNSSVTIKGITFAAKSLLLLGAKFSEAKENHYEYQRWEWDLGVNVDTSDGWEILKIDDRGYTFYDAGYYKPIVVGEPPEKTPTSWPLDGSGGKKPNASDAPASLEFKPYYPRSFSVFSFTP